MQVNIAKQRIPAAPYVPPTQNKCGICGIIQSEPLRDHMIRNHLKSKMQPTTLNEKKQQLIDLLTSDPSSCKTNRTSQPDDQRQRGGSQHRVDLSSHQTLSSDKQVDTSSKENSDPSASNTIAQQSSMIVTGANHSDKSQLKSILKKSVHFTDRKSDGPIMKQDEVQTEDRSIVDHLASQQQIKDIQTIADNYSAISERTVGDGPAKNFLKDNQFAKWMTYLINKRGITERSPEKQLQYAIMGGAKQCQNCYKLMAPGDYFQRHVRRCLRGLVYKVSFLKMQGMHFCYFGCDKFEDRITLVKHLIACHASRLWVWGLSKDYLLPSTEGKCLTKVLDSNYSNTPQPPNEKIGQHQDLMPSKESWLVQSLLAVSESENLQLRVTSQKVSTVEASPMWLILRHNYVSFTNSWSRLINLLQSRHFIAGKSAERPRCMPPMPRIEVVQDRTVSVGYPLNVASTASICLDNRHWTDMKELLIAAGSALVDLHSKEKIFQGGIQPHTIAYSKTSQNAFFLNWGYSCTKENINKRLIQKNHYYFKNSSKATFHDLIVSDILAFMLIYADLVMELNCITARPSDIIKRQWAELPTSDWNTWLKDSKLTGLDLIDKLIISLAEEGIKNENDLVINFMHILTKNMGRNDVWAYERLEIDENQGF